LGRVVTFQSVESVVRRVDGGNADLLLDYSNVFGRLFQPAQSFLGQWVLFCQRDRDLRKPTELLQSLKDWSSSQFLNARSMALLASLSAANPRSPDRAPKDCRVLASRETNFDVQRPIVNSQQPTTAGFLG
jgi:hypothetical protein